MKISVFFNGWVIRQSLGIEICQRITKAIKQTNKQTKNSDCPLCQQIGHTDQKLKEERPMNVFRKQRESSAKLPVSCVEAKLMKTSRKGDYSVVDRYVQLDRSTKSSHSQPYGQECALAANTLLYGNNPKWRRLKSHTSADEIEQTGP